MQRRFFGLLLGLALVGSAERARAEDEHSADELFAYAQAALEKSRIHEACALFAESVRKDPAPGALLNLAVCHEKEERLATAWRDFVRASEVCGARGQAERAQFAASEAAALALRVPRVDFARQDTAAIASATLDGAPVDASSLGAPLPVDAGAHAIVLHANGMRPRTVLFTIASGAGVTRIEVPAFEPEVTPSNLEAAPSPRVPAHDARAHDSIPPRRLVAYGLGGAAIVAIGIGSYFGLRTFSEQKDSQSHCTGTYCDAVGVDDRAGARADAAISTFAFGAGLLAGGAAVYLLLTESASTRTAAWHALPIAGANAAGLVLRRSW